MSTRTASIERTSRARRGRSEQRDAFVDIAGSIHCTGVHLRYEWVLTTVDCGAIAGTVVSRNDDSSTVDDVLVDPQGLASVPTQLDTAYARDALLHLATPLPVNGVSAGYARRLRSTFLNLWQAVR